MLCLNTLGVYDACLAKPEVGEVISFSIGTLSGGVLLSVGYLLDGMEVQT